jgi:hypothetical protein
VSIFLFLSLAPPANCLAAASLPPAPKAIGRKREPKDPDELLARAKANGYRRGEHREQTKYDQDGALRRYVVYEGPLYSFTSPVLTQSSRWKLDEMREDAKRRGITPSDERIAREHCLSKGVEAPNLAAVKDFLRFQTSVMRGKIGRIPTDESLNCFAEWFFGGFARVTETVPTISYAIFVNLLSFGLAGLVRIIREGTVSGTIDYSRLVIGEKSRRKSSSLKNAGTC